MSKNTIFLSMERGPLILLRIIHKNPPLGAEMILRIQKGVLAKIGRIKIKKKAKNEIFRSLCEGLLAKSPSSRLGCSSGRHGVREVSFSLFFFFQL